MKLFDKVLHVQYPNIALPEDYTGFYVVEYSAYDKKGYFAVDGCHR
jgi:hypothetical protein